MSPPLRIAVPNKGTLSDTASSMLIEAGYVGRRDPRSLAVPDPRNGVEFFFLRPLWLMLIKMVDVSGPPSFTFLSSS